jgi:hypothetical protein
VAIKSKRLNLGKLKHQVVSICYQRDDMDYAVLATVNNIDKHLTTEQFVNVINGIVVAFQIALPDEDVVVFNREDATDYLGVDKDGNIL